MAVQVLVEPEPVVQRVAVQAVAPVDQAAAMAATAAVVMAAVAVATANADLYVQFAVRI